MISVFCRMSFWLFHFFIWDFHSVGKLSKHVFICSGFLCLGRAKTEGPKGQKGTHFKTEGPKGPGPKGHLTHDCPSWKDYLAYILAFYFPADNLSGIYSGFLLLARAQMTNHFVSERETNYPHFPYIPGFWSWDVFGYLFVGFKAQRTNQLFLRQKKKTNIFPWIPGFWTWGVFQYLFVGLKTPATFCSEKKIATFFPYILGFWTCDVFQYLFVSLFSSFPFCFWNVFVVWLHSCQNIVIRTAFF